MAFSDNKITTADLTGKGVVGLADTPNLTTSQMQQKLDEVGKDVIVPKFNALCDDLDETDFATLITSKSTDKMLFQRLNEYDQMEYSVDNVNWSLIASGKEVLDPTLEADNAKKLGGQLPAYYQKTTDNTLDTTSKTTTGAINEINTALSEEIETVNNSLSNIIEKKGEDWVYVVGDAESLNWLRYKVANNRCYIEMNLSSLHIGSITQFINDNTFPKPYGIQYANGISGTNTNIGILITINVNGGLSMASTTEGDHYPISRFDYELAP